MVTANLETNVHLLTVIKTCNLKTHLQCHRWAVNLISKISCRIFPSNLETWWLQILVLTNNWYLVNNKTCNQLVKISKVVHNLKITWVKCNNINRCFKCNNNKIALVAAMVEEINLFRTILKIKDNTNSSNYKCWIQWWCNSKCTCRKCKCHQCISLSKMVCKSSYLLNNLNFLNRPTWLSTMLLKHYRIILRLDSKFLTSCKAKINFIM